jgi:hypothetical protein
MKASVNCAALLAHLRADTEDLEADVHAVHYRLLVRVLGD